MQAKKQTPILFITGAFVSHAVWNQWISYFEERGYSAIAPAWPEKEGTAKQLRNLQPNDLKLATLKLEQVIDHYIDIAARFEYKPIVIGHSLGGLIAQILLNRGYAVGGVAIHAVPPQGVFPYEFTFLRSTWKLLGLFSSLRKTFLMSFSDFQYAFVNGVPLDQQKLDYDLYAIPESRTVARGGLTRAAAVDFRKNHPPLLLTAGLSDHVIPAHLSRRVYNRYKKNGSVIDYMEFPTNHGIITHKDWKTEASFIGNWINEHIYPGSTKNESSVKNI